MSRAGRRALALIPSRPPLLVPGHELYGGRPSSVEVGGAVRDAVRDVDVVPLRVLHLSHPPQSAVRRSSRAVSPIRFVGRGGASNGRSGALFYAAKVQLVPVVAPPNIEVR